MCMVFKSGLFLQTKNIFLNNTTSLLSKESEHHLPKISNLHSLMAPWLVFKGSSSFRRMSRNSTPRSSVSSVSSGKSQLHLSWQLFNIKNLQFIIDQIQNFQFTGKSSISLGSKASTPPAPKVAAPRYCQPHWKVSCFVMFCQGIVRYCKVLSR